MQVIFEAAVGQLGPGLVASGVLGQTNPKYGSLAGMLIGIQSGSFEPQGQLFELH